MAEGREGRARQGRARVKEGGCFVCGWGGRGKGGEKEKERVRARARARARVRVRARAKGTGVSSEWGGGRQGEVRSGLDQGWARVETVTPPRQRTRKIEEGGWPWKNNEGQVALLLEGD